MQASMSLKYEPVSEPPIPSHPVTRGGGVSHFWPLSHFGTLSRFYAQGDKFLCLIQGYLAHKKHPPPMTLQ